MTAFRFVTAAATLAVLGLAGSSQAALFGYDDTYWGNSIGTASPNLPDPPLQISIDPAVANGWATNPASFHGVAIAPNAPGYYGNTQFPGNAQNWKHEQLLLTFSDGSSAAYDQVGQQASMIAPVAYSSGYGHNIGPDIVDTGTNWLGGGNGAYMVLYNWNLGTTPVTGKTVTAATVTVQTQWSESTSLVYNAFAIPAAWDRTTVTYHTFVPEPASMSLLGLGALGLLARRRSN